MSHFSANYANGQDGLGDDIYPPSFLASSSSSNTQVAHIAYSNYPNQRFLQCRLWNQFRYLPQQKESTITKQTWFGKP